MTINANNISTFSYKGTMEDIPEIPTLGDLRIDASPPNSLYVYNGETWEPMSLTKVGNIMDDLEEIVNKYPSSEISKDIKALLEIYRMRIYE